MCAPVVDSGEAFMLTMMKEEVAYEARLDTDRDRASRL